MAVFVDLASTIENDRSATLVFARWLGQPSHWLDTILRIQRRAGVFGKFTTVSDFFLSSSYPDGSTRTFAHEYGCEVPTAIDESLRFQFDSLAAAEALLAVATGSDQTPIDALEDGIERGEEPTPPLASQLATLAVERQSQLVDALLDAGSASGYLIFNGSAATRRGLVKLTGTNLNAVPGGPVKAIQHRDGDTFAVVDVPGWGYTWFENPNSGAKPDAAEAKKSSGMFRREKSEAPLALGRRLGNEFLQAEIDVKTGGLRGVWSTRSGYSRLGQQLADSHGGRAVCERVEVVSQGPAVGEISTHGHLLSEDGKRRTARFVQRFSLAAARPVLEVDIELSFEAQTQDAEARAIVSRWAWPDDKAKFFSFDGFALTPHRTGDLVSPWFFELRERNLSTAIFPHGACVHRRIGARMADTALTPMPTQLRSPRFHFSIGLDLAHPWSILDDWRMPLIAIEGQDRKTKAGATGWLMQLTPADVHCFQLRPVPADKPTVRLGLIETAGASNRATIRCCRNPSLARLVNARGEMQFELFVDGDSTQVDFAAHEMQFVELVF